MTTLEGTVVHEAGAVDSGGDRVLCGTLIGCWRVEHLLGRGGMGDVHAVVHEQIGKRAALKMMHRTLASDVDAERARLEGQIVNRIDHPNLVDIFDAGTFDGRPYLVMERLEGMTLAHLAGNSKIRPDVVIGILAQLCEVLAAVHAAGIIHRDLKPDNVFLVAGQDPGVPQVKLLDWGIAKVLDDDSRRTREGQLIGTPSYLSPEQACGRAVSAKSDVYALGVLAYELFVEQLPFEASSPFEMLKAHFREAPQPPRELWPDIPESLEQLLLAMLAKDPDQRPTTEAVLRLLRRASAELSARCKLGGPALKPSRALVNDELARTVYSATLPITAAIAVSRVRRTLQWHRRAGVLTVVLALVVALGMLVQYRPQARASASSVPTPDQRPAEVVTPPELVLTPSAAKVVLEPPVVVPPPAPIPTSVRQAATADTRPRRAPAVALTTEAVTESASALADHYVRVGRALKLQSAAVDVADLWRQYRQLRIYEAMATDVTRAQATRVLTRIQGELGARRNVSTSATCSVVSN